MMIEDEHKSFHGIILQKMMESVNGFPEVRKTADISMNTDLIIMYAGDTELNRQSLERQASATEESTTMGMWSSTTTTQTSIASQIQSLCREAEEARTERDLWTLLDIVTRADLLCDLNDADCELSFQSAISQLTERNNIEEVMDTAYVHDSRLKKGRVLLDWLEGAAADRVSTSPASRGDAWSNTLFEIMKTSNRGSDKSVISNQAKVSTRNSGKQSTVTNAVKSMHPDAQLTFPDCLMLPLNGVDRDYQEAVLKCIWQLVRCGKVIDAQNEAVKHRLFWLAASLSGHFDSYYENIPSSENKR